MRCVNTGSGKLDENVNAYLDVDGEVDVLLVIYEVTDMSVVIGVRRI